LITEVIKTLASGEALHAKYKDHNLSGNYAGCKECHITPDWLLIYELTESDLILYLTRTGTHRVVNRSHRKVQMTLRQASITTNFHLISSIAFLFTYIYKKMR
jgi:addiction module RelE/StbE family toxin